MTDATPLLEMRLHRRGVDLQVPREHQEYVAHRRCRQHQLTEQAGTAGWKCQCVGKTEGRIGKATRCQVKQQASRVE
jgi:hypothetical protein